jgi:uncharacterized protein (DUF433 family)
MLVSSNPAILGGIPCFHGTRVPVESLFDWLEQGHTVDEFLKQFPSVTRRQIDGVLELAKREVPRAAQRDVA